MFSFRNKDFLSLIVRLALFFFFFARCLLLTECVSWVTVITSWGINWFWGNISLEDQEWLQETPFSSTALHYYKNSCRRTVNIGNSKWTEALTLGHNTSWKTIKIETFFWPEQSVLSSVASELACVSHMLTPSLAHKHASWKEIYSVEQKAEEDWLCRYVSWCSFMKTKGMQIFIIHSNQESI